MAWRAHDLAALRGLAGAGSSPSQPSVSLLVKFIIGPTCGKPKSEPARPPRSAKEMLVSLPGRDYKRCGKVRKDPEPKVNYYAHTAVKSDGTPKPARGQLLSTHRPRLVL